MIVWSLPPLTCALEVRRARPDDVPVLARVRSASWAAAYAEILPASELRRVSTHRSAAYLSQAAADRRAGRRLLVVAERGADPFGYALCGPQQDPRLRTYRGEVYELYLHPDRQRQGAGRRLLSQAIWDLLGDGLDPVMLWVLARNSARHFYESCGGMLVASSPIVLGGVRTTKLAYGWDEALPLPGL